MNKLSVNIIVKNGKGHLEKTVASLCGLNYDELVIVDTGSTDGTQDIARRIADTYRDYEDQDPVIIDGEKYLSDFSAARNYARILSRGEYIFWIDADDVLYNPAGLNRYVDEFIRTGRFDLSLMWYDYDHDEFGNCVFRNVLNRICKKDYFVWKSPVHEVLCAMTSVKRDMVPASLSRVVHDISQGDMTVRSVRNTQICEKYLSTHGTMEPRTWLHYARGLMSLKEYDRAIEAFERYLAGSHWNHEKYHVHIAIGQCHKALNRFEEAFESTFRAIKLIPGKKEAPLELAKLYFNAEDHKSALIWCDYMDRMEGGEDLYMENPFAKALGSTRIRATCYVAMGEFEKGIVECDKLLSQFPVDRETLAMKVFAAKLLREKELSDSYKKLEFMVVLENDREKLDHLRQAIPRALKNSPDVEAPVNIEVSDKKRIAFMCGQSHETWGHDSHLKGGIGGSETAVIHLSRELAALGWQVEVYAYPSEEQEGLKDGVLWLPFWRYRYAKTPDIYVAWRDGKFVDFEESPIPKYVWLHDIQYSGNWNEELIEKVTAVIPLSVAHRETCLFIPEEKIWYSENGIDEGFFRDLKNQPTRLIYASAPNRGLHTLLKLWPGIKRAVPSATLDVFYGFTKNYFEDMKSEPDLAEIYSYVMGNITQPGIHYHGRVPQDALADYFSQCGIWAYPTSFYEISCITAMQAQANGAIPVSTGYAALNETVQYGVKVGGVSDIIEQIDDLQKLWVKDLISLMLDPSRQEEIRKDMVPWARKAFSWKKVAKHWHERFLNDLRIKGHSTLATVQS